MAEEEKNEVEGNAEEQDEESSEESAIEMTCPPEISQPQFSEEQLVLLQNCTVNQLLRQNQAGLFELVYQSRKLIPKILYCLAYILVFAGCYGFILEISSGFLSAGMMALKIPFLFLITAAILTPLLFSFNLFLGSRLNIGQTVAILLIATYEMAATLVSLSPILLLFVISSQGKIFVNIVNIIFFVIAVSVGLGLVWRAMAYFTKRNQSTAHTLVLKVWLGIYAFVGMQLAWAIQVFGDLSELPVFKQLGIEGNFYMAIFELVKRWMEK